MKPYYLVSIERTASLLWSLLFISVLLIAYANTCLADPEKNTSQVKVTLPFAKENLSIEKKGEYDQVSLKDAMMPQDEPGTPWLPASFVNVRVPDGAKVVSVSVNVLKETLIAKGLNVYPTQPSVRGHQPAPEFVKPNAAAYKSKAKKELGKGAQTQQMREYTFVPVRINPVRLIAATGELYLAETVEITVEYQTNPQAAPAKAKGKDDPFEKMMRNLVVNPDISYKSLDSEAPVSSSSEPIPSVESAPVPESATVESLVPGLCEYLIITSSDLADSFQPLANHRAAFNGVTTKILTISTINASYTGIDIQTKIRACIKDYVATRGTLYVLIGGSGVKVPGRILEQSPGYTIPSDMYYAGLDGTWDNIDSDGKYGEEILGVGAEGDLMADVILGRLPFTSPTEVNQYTNKLINYEKNPPVGIEKKLIINGGKTGSIYYGDDRPSDLMNDGHLAFRDANHPNVSDAEMWLRRLYRDCIQVHGWQPSKLGILMDTLTSWDSTTGGNYPANAANIVTRYNENWNFVFNLTHGMRTYLVAEGDEFDRSHAASLTGLTTIFCTLACDSAMWDFSYPSIGSAMLSNPTGGALAYIGDGRPNSYTPDYSPASNTSTSGAAAALPRAFANVVFGNRPPDVGAAYVAHQLKVNAITSIVGTSSYNMYRDSFYGVNLLGDPLLALRTEATRPLVATHSPFVKLNQPFVVHVTRDGSPLNGSNVRIWNANERYEALTDANGNATFTLSTVSIVGMRVMATALNSIPYHGALNVQLDANPLVIVKATSAAASEIGPIPGTWTFYRSDNIASSLTVYFSLGGNATPGSDYTIASTSSLTFPAGAASKVLTLTPVDDSAVGELTETAILTILPNSTYTIDQLPAVISIKDGDSTPPVVNAGQDQIGYLRTIPWTPSELPAAAWYDAADLTSLTQSSGWVSVVKDKSGNGKHATQFATSYNLYQPSSGGAINGVHALTFTGAYDYLDVPTLGFSGSAYLAYVAQPVNDGTFGLLGVVGHFDVSNYSSTYGGIFRSTPLGPVSAGFPTNAAYMGAYEANSAAPFYNIYNNGTRKVNSTAAFTFNDNLTGINTQSGYGNKMAGQFGEMLALNFVPSTDIRQKIEGYLAHKWGLGAKLPAGHSYLNASPWVDRVAVQLVGTASDFENDPLIISWSKVSGPGPVTFFNASALSTQAIFNVAGVYTIRLNAYDGTTQSTNDVVITVKWNKAPVVSAGPDRTVASLSNEPWSPKTAITPAAWFDASDLTTLTEVSGAISQWRDKSGRSKHANQATSTARPVLGLINNVQALTFDGSSDYMTVPKMGSSGSAYLAYVAQPVNDTSFTVMAPNAWEVYNGSAYPRVFRSAQIGPVYPGFPTNAAYIAAYEANSATPIYNVYNNGTRKVANTTAFTFSDNWSAINTSGSNKMAGQIGEILALNYMPSTEVRQKIEGYLAHKWGLIAGLPTGHPYKVVAPGPPAMATLNGAASDVDGIPLPMTTSWTLVSGPQPVVFTNPKAVITDVLFTAPGVYRFKLTAYDGLDQGLDECLITISSAVVVDGDMDGMNDAWEIANFGGIGASNGSGDSDGDGSSDKQEYLAGTNPNDSNSLLKIASTTTINKTEMVLTFNAVVGKTYKLLASSNLTASSWQPIQTGIIGVSPTTSVTVPITGGSKFFIIQLE